MKAGTAARILLCAQAGRVEDVRRLLEQGGHDIGWHALNESEPEDLAAYHMVVLDDGRLGHEGVRLCRRLRAGLSACFMPILYLTSDPTPEARQASLEGGADGYLLRPFAAGELHAQVRAFLRIKDTHDRLADKTAEVHRVNKRLQQAYQQIDQELALVRRIQLSSLPQALPETPRVCFAVHYAPRAQVGGDFYDAFRLDEHHVGFYVADAMGHGVPAGLLTVFVKENVRSKEVFGRQYRLVPPDEGLQRLNRALVEQELSENPFLTMVYALLNHQDGTLQFARAGHPFPLLVPRRGDLRFLRVEGSLLGVFDTQFPSAVHPLRAGDKVVLFSDGMNAAQFGDQSRGNESLLACATQHRDLPIGEFIERLARDLFSKNGRTDDLTLLGVEMRE
jgi:sigma-B regulation protein RsbU (phosphoserine phosphatase)